MYKNHKIVVTMTSWTKRINNCVPVLQSILDNTLKPDNVYLNLSVEEFPKKEDGLPSSLVKFIQEHPTVILNWVDGPNTKTMKKVFPILKYLDDEDIIINTDDDKMFPKEVLKVWIDDFFKHNKQYVITNCGIESKNWGIIKMDQMWGNAVYQKKMLSGWEQFYVDKVIRSYHDDRFYLSMFYLNGYKTIGACDYQQPIHRTKHKLNGSFHAVQGMTKTKGYLPDLEFDKVFRPLAEKAFGKKFDKLFGVFRGEYMMVNEEKNYMKYHKTNTNYLFF